MFLLNADINYIGIFIAVASLLVGVLTWWIGKLLNDKKDITILQVKLDDIERRVRNNEEDIKEVQDWYNKGRNN